MTGVIAAPATCGPRLPSTTASTRPRRDFDATMGLDDFERELAASKAQDSRRPSQRKRDRSRSRDRHLRHKHHHPSRHDDARDERHRHKRSKHHRETSEERATRKRCEQGRDEDKDGHSRRKAKGRKSPSPSDDGDGLTSKRKSRHQMYEEDSPSEDELMDKDYPPPNDDFLDHQLEEAADANLQRDDWMRAPSSMDVDYVQRKKRDDKSTFVGASTEQKYAHKVHQAELNHHLRGVQGDDAAGEQEPVQQVSYTFGDSGSQWRMTKLKGVYRIAEEERRPVEEVALEKYGHLRDFDDAREEEIEVDRRKMYGRDYVGKEKPSGELFEERRLKAGIHRPAREPSHLADDLPQGQVVSDPRPTANTVVLSQTELNKLKAQMMKAKMKGAANAAELEAQYNAALSGAANRIEPDVVVLNSMDNRMLAGGRQGEVKELTNKRGRERGLVVENDDMSVEDMLRQERRTKGQAGGEGMLLAEKIAKDSKFDVSASSFQPYDDAYKNRMTLTILMRTPRNSPLVLPNPRSTFATKQFPTTNAQTAFSTPAPFVITKTNLLRNPPPHRLSLLPPGSSSPCLPSPKSATVVQLLSPSSTVQTSSNATTTNGKKYATS